MSLDFSRYLFDKTKRNTFHEIDACRIAAYCVQNGVCYVTGTPLTEGERELHHRLPRSFGGKDIPQNLILLNRTIHLMIHAQTSQQFQKLLASFPLTAQQLQFVNQLRHEAHRTPISMPSNA